jgi:hypothetical protein
MTGNRVKIWAIVAGLIANIALISIGVRAQPPPQTIFRVMANGEVRSVAVPHINPQALLAHGENHAVRRMGDVVQRIQPSPAIRNLAALGAFAIPETYWTHERGTGAVVETQPVILLDAPMRFDPASKDFRGSLSILFQETGQTATRNLAVPIQVEVKPTQADRVSPTSLAFDHTSLPTQAVEVVSGNPQDFVEVRFITATNTTGYAAQLPVEPSLTIGQGQTRLQAYGIETTTLVVTRRPLGTAKPPIFNVVTTGGYVNPATLDLQSGQALVSIRSSGVGKRVVQVIGPGYRTVEAELEYVFPWAFLIATVVGTCLGSLIRILQRRNWNLRFFILRLLIGFFVVCAWVILGLNLMNFALPPYYNEGVAFTLGGLASWVYSTRKPKGNT